MHRCGELRQHRDQVRHQLSITSGIRTADTGTSRLALLFATGDTIDAGKTISAAELWFYVSSSPSMNRTWNIVIQNGQPTYPHDPVVLADYYKGNYSGDGGSIGNTAITSPGWNKIDLNATGLTWIQKGAGNKTKLMVRLSRDIAGEAPPAPTYSDDCGFATAYLVVTWLD